MNQLTVETNLDTLMDTEVKRLMNLAKSRLDLNTELPPIRLWEILQRAKLNSMRDLSFGVGF